MKKRMNTQDRQKSIAKKNKNKTPLLSNGGFNEQI